jgi:eukaryotic-like serine/threonine-protein kinase
MEKRPEAPEAFEELIGAIADGEPIDWVHLEESKYLRRKEIAAARAIAGLRDATDELARAAANPEHGFDRIEEIGHGAFGRVWRARDRVLGREVALKVLENDAGLTLEQRERYLREARALAACEHENIVRIHSVGERDGHLELCLELLDGVTLEQLVRDGGPLSAEEAARIGSDLCRALAALHSRGLLHRDVKPANVMRVRGGRVVLLDFGLAHAADPVGCRASLAGGTPLFMAPELLAHASDFDARVDVYSLGVTLYWLATAKWPYEAASREELIEKMKREPPIPLLDRRPDLPPAFVALVERALAREPRDRFASAGKMDAALRAIVEARSRRRTWRLVAVAAAAAIVLTAGAVMMLLANRTEFEMFRLTATEPGSGAIAVPIALDAKVARGDEVRARIHLDHDAYVIGFCIDRAGHAFAIYPLEEADLRKKLKAGWTQLPGVDGPEHAQDRWQIRGASGLLSIFLAISSEPRPDLEEKWRATPKLLYDLFLNDPARGGDDETAEVAPAPAEVELKDELLRLAAGPSQDGVTVRKFGLDKVAR